MLHEKWVFMEHRFVRGGRVAMLVLIRGLFRARDGVVTRRHAHRRAFDCAPGLGAGWSVACDRLASEVRAEEALA